MTRPNWPSEATVVPKEPEIPVWPDTRRLPPQNGWKRWTDRFDVEKYGAKDPRSFEEDTLN